MSNELQFYGTPANDSGLTVVARVYNNAGVQVGSDVACAEVGVLAIYMGDMPTAGAGGYTVRFFNGATLMGQGPLFWDGTVEVTDLTLDTLVKGIDDADAVWDATLEGSETASDMMRLMRAALIGKAAGAATTVMTFRDAADSKARITATVDESGNRSSVTVDAS